MQRSETPRALNPIHKNEAGLPRYADIALTMLQRAGASGIVPDDVSVFVVGNLSSSNPVQQKSIEQAAEALNDLAYLGVGCKKGDRYYWHSVCR